MKFKLLEENLGLEADTIVYKYIGYDYGLCRDDEAITGEVHITITEDKGGGPPYYTAPISVLEPLDEDAKEYLDRRKNE